MTCPKCDGTGYTYIEYPVFVPSIEEYDPNWHEIDCPHCDGTGEVIDEAFLSLLMLSWEEIKSLCSIDDEREYLVGE